MMKFSICFMVIASSVALAYAKGDNCDDLGILIYEDLGCTPKYSDGDKSCPVSFDCGALKPGKDECLFRGKSYKAGEQVDSIGCDIGCFCSNFLEHARFQCAAVDCPQWLGLRPGNNCYFGHEKLNRCCASRTICPADKPTENCLVDGKQYREGDTFYRDNSCEECLCQKKSDGSALETTCQRIQCNSQLRNTKIAEGCSPIYRQSKGEGVFCCPADYVCPQGSDLIQGKSSSDGKCEFGTQSLGVGQFFERNVDLNIYGQIVKKLRCDCSIPPLLTCYQVE